MLVAQMSCMYLIWWFLKLWNVYQSAKLKLLPILPLCHMVYIHILNICNKLYTAQAPTQFAICMAITWKIGTYFIPNIIKSSYSSCNWYFFADLNHAAVWGRLERLYHKMSAKYCACVLIENLATNYYGLWDKFL